jgi:hypothetical protein
VGVSGWCLKGRGTDAKPNAEDDGEGNLRAQGSTIRSIRTTVCE